MLSVFILLINLGHSLSKTIDRFRKSPTFGHVNLKYSA